MVDFPHRSTNSSFLDAYSFRIMLGWIASLGILLLVVHLPLQGSEERVGWAPNRPVEQISVSEVRPEQASEETPSQEAPPPTPHSQPEEAPETEEASEENVGEEVVSDESPSGDAVRPISALGISDQTPEIVGGMGSLYLHIDYPEEARRKGIEGRLLLEFTVDTDGQAQSIEVAESLHPLCDSAAVAGIRRVQFVPAKSNGNEVPIRMRLPVRFRLMSDSTTSETADAGTFPPR